MDIHSYESLNYYNQIQKGKNQYQHLYLYHNRKLIHTCIFYSYWNQRNIDNVIKQQAKKYRVNIEEIEWEVR